MIKPSDDCIYFWGIVLFVVFMAGLFVLVFGVLVSPSGASSGVRLTPGHIQVDSCATSASIPIINWTKKGWLQIVELEPIGNCKLLGKWDSSMPGYYCTGIGNLGEENWVPDECIDIKPNKIVKKKFYSVWKYRYP